MDRMRINLNSIACYILIELDFYLKIHKDGKNYLYISVTNKKRYYHYTKTELPWRPGIFLAAKFEPPRNIVLP